MLVMRAGRTANPPLRYIHTDRDRTPEVGAKVLPGPIVRQPDNLFPGSNPDPASAFGSGFAVGAIRDR